MDSREYWRKREAENLARNLKTEAEYTEELHRYYDSMMDQIQKEINGFYGKYAKAEGITLAEAKRRVDKLDIEAYGRKAAKYVKEKNFSKEANEEMRLYNATMKINRLEMLKANIGLELVDGFDGVQKYFDKVLTERTLSEFERQAGILGGTVQNNAKKAKAIVNSSFNNARYSDRIWMYQNMMKAELSKLLQQGLIQGKNPKQLAAHLQKLFGVRKSDAERLMRTELARVQTEAQKQSFERNGYDKYEFVALGNACSICKAIDGQAFDVKKMMPGENAPPMHPNCRCSVAAYMDRKEFNEWLEKQSIDGIIEPKDKGALNTSLDDLSLNVIEASLQVNNYLNTLDLPESKWSGMTIIKSRKELRNHPGKKAGNCDIWLVEKAPLKTVIHEHLHARSSSRMPRKYVEFIGFEEGACELLAEEICKKNGIKFSPSYKEYVNPIRKFNKIAKICDNDYDFALAYFRVDLDKRKQWLEDIAENAGLVNRVRLKRQIEEVIYGDE